jgi:ribosomal protein S18 acetylase RimI-like enzyme
MNAPGDPLRLRPMRADELPAFREAFVRDWAADLAIVDGLAPAGALAEAARRTDASLPDGVATAGHFLHVILAGDTAVGTLWFSIDERRHAFLDDITIGEAFRGAGHGRGALALFEEQARALGAVQVDLHVYRHNPRAIQLYERVGYQTTGLKMRKVLG